MDAFNIIQELFTNMQCHFCEECFEPEDIQLIREEDAMYVVNVFCHHCNTQNGIAMVSIGNGDDISIPIPGQGFLQLGEPYEDPELTPEELERLSNFDIVDENTVIDAHKFIQNLDSSWMKHIPEHLKETTLEIPG